MVPAQARVAVSPSGTDHYRDPSLAVLPDGRVIVAFRNEPSEQVETETCTFLPAPPAANYCGAADRRASWARAPSSATSAAAGCRRRASWPPEGA